MNTLSPIQPGSPQEMRARVFNTIDLCKLGYITIAEMTRMARRIINEYTNHQQAQLIAFGWLLVFMEDMLTESKAGKH
ncbi:MAG: hypothetical protein IKW19_08795 [Akkermansia sp.]|nr:hypothetical protein [Akkermansia sp.]MBR5186380.1 hypothetical protein [Akkermansia sp.]